MIRSILICLTLAAAPVCSVMFFPVVSLAQDSAEKADTEKSAPEPVKYKTYEELFDAFEKRRSVLVTKMDRLREAESISPDAFKAIQSEMISLDNEYAESLQKYISGHAEAKDLMPARFERAVTLSRLEDKLAEAVDAADEFLKHHKDSELAVDAEYVRAQTLFRIPDRAEEALKAMDAFLKSHSDRREADSIRMMRVRTMLFLNRVEDAKSELGRIAKLRAVKKDKAAKKFIDTQRKNLDWVGQELPKFAFKDLAGNVVDNESLKGKPALFFFWDSTSNACLNELGFVQGLQKEYGEKMKIVGLSINESKTAFEQWMKRQKKKPDFANAWIDRVENGTILKKLDVKLMPFSVLIDADGKIFRYDVRSDDLLRYAPIITEMK